MAGVDSEPSALGFLLQPRGEDGGERAAFASLAHRLGVREAAWTVAHGGIASTLRQLGAWNDLAILERDMVQGSHLFDILGEAMLGCRIPCLVLPPRWYGELCLDLVAVCWDGSIESTRAMHAALPFLLAANRVVLINGCPYASTEESSTPFDPVHYLLRHGIAARQRFIEVSPSLAGEVILRETRDMGASLLVMGAYGHSRLRERVLGGATRHILEHAALPLLMQH
ncbi:MAG TPA: universal stress protein [Rhodanobacter sp.]